MTPSFALLGMLPILAPIVGALLILLADAALRHDERIHSWISLSANGIGLAAAVWLAADGGLDRVRTGCLPAPSICFIDGSGVGLVLEALALFGGLIVTLLLRTSLRWGQQRGGSALTHTLLLTAVAGASIVAVSRDVATWLIGLELATLPVVALVALHGSRRAAHGSLSLLTTSVVSFALLVVGVALWLVATHTSTFGGAGVNAAWTDSQRRPALILSVILLLAGLGFKISAVPFHQWTPSAYRGSSVPVAALLASVSKVASIGALVVLVRGLLTLVDSQHPHQIALAVGVVAAITMTLGNLVALRQDDIVAFLAWSTIAQAGWVLLPLAALSEAALPAAVGYTGAYVLASLLVFTVVHHVAGRAGTRTERSAYAGLFTRNRMLGGAFALGLVSLAGLPPGVIGLIAKVVALGPVVDGGLWVLAGVAVVNAVIGVAVYLRWVAVLFSRVDSQEPDPARIAAPGRAVIAALVLEVGALLVTSVLPQLLLGLTR